MKWDCGPTAEEKREIRRKATIEKTRRMVAEDEKWHDYFAFTPTRVGPRDCRWFETIERRVRFRYKWSRECETWLSVPTSIEYRAKDRNGSVPQPA